MASHPPGECCTVGFKHDGTPSGSIETVAGASTYIARPSSEKHAGKAILILTDVMGHVAPNAQLLADQFADRGYLVVMPDLFRGDAVPVPRPANWDLTKWLYGEEKGGVGPGHTPPHVKPVVDATIKAMREEMGIKAIGAVGYCFGGAHVVLQLAKGGGVDVGYTAHPSFVEEEDLAKVAGPLSISAAEIDTIFTTESRHKSEKILIETKQPFQINLFSEVAHGFAVRGDLSKPQIKFAREQAFLQAVQWFDYWLHDNKTMEGKSQL